MDEIKAGDTVMIEGLEVIDPFGSYVPFTGRAMVEHVSQHGVLRILPEGRELMVWIPADRFDEYKVRKVDGC